MPPSFPGLGVSRRLSSERSERVETRGAGASSFGLGLVVEQPLEAAYDETTGSGASSFGPFGPCSATGWGASSFGLGLVVEQPLEAA
ncbi:MAG TPA: hypothetical protein PKK40_10805, partial [Marmoricola sp.]|nr:hypothetical protein [Marmoricola sp.]